MAEERSLNFLEEIIEEDLKSGKYKQIITRFPPGTEWLFAHRSCIKHLFEFWFDQKISRLHQSSF